MLEGEHTSADPPGAEYNFSWPHVQLPVCQEVCALLTDTSWSNELGESGIDGLFILNAELRSKNRILFAFLVY